MEEHIQSVQVSTRKENMYFQHVNVRTFNNYRCLPFVIPQS